MLNMVAPYHTKMEKYNSLGLALDIDPHPQEEFSPDTTLYKPPNVICRLLRVAALACNIMLCTLPTK